MAENRQTHATGFVVIRQPVFDRKLEPQGTAVSFSQPKENAPLFADEFTAGIVLEAHLPQRGPKHPRTIVSFDAAAVRGGVPRLVPVEGMVVEVEEAEGEAPDICDAVAELKAAGYGIAVGGFRNRSACRTLNRLADVIVIDAKDPAVSSDENALQNIILDARLFGAKVQVRGLGQWRQMLQARTANADLFQGFFFNQMNLAPSTKAVTATQLSRLRLLELLDKPDADFRALARVVEADAVLTYRLLVFLNSASFGLARKVESIQQAIVLAGWKPLKDWLKIVLLTDLSHTPRHQELCYYAAQRSGFLQRVARVAGLERLVPALSLLGLLSNLEPILEMPPEQALAGVPVSDDIRLALCGRKSPLSPWLSLVRAMENADWEQAERLGKSAGLGMSDLAQCQHSSFTEADTLFRSLPEPESAPQPARVR